MSFLIFEVPEREDTRCMKLRGADHVHRYRGTFRDMPTLVDFPPGHELHQVLMAALQASPEPPEMEDLNTAIEIVELLACYDPGKHYEIVELTANDAGPEIGSRLIGYDVSICNHLSLVWIALIACNPKASDKVVDADLPDDLRRVLPLVDMLETFFYQKLNEDGLFSTYSDAVWFLNCIRLISDMCPNIWESPQLMTEFQVTGLYEVMRQSTSPDNS